MPFGLDFENHLRAALVALGWRLYGNRHLDKEENVDFIVVGHGDRHWQTMIEVQLTFRARSLEKLLDFLETSAGRQNDNVKVYVVLTGSPSVEAIANTVNDAFVRKVFRNSFPNGVYLLEVDDRCVGYWREPGAFAAKIRERRQLALMNDQRKRGSVKELLDSGFVIRWKPNKGPRVLYFARYSDIAKSNAHGRSSSEPVRVGDVVTFLPTDTINSFGELLAEYVFIKHPNKN